MFSVGAAVARLTRGGFGENTYLGIDNYNKDIWAGARHDRVRAAPTAARSSASSGDYHP